MSGRLFKGILLLLVFAMAMFVAAPIASGEHPWGSDRGTGDGDTDTGTVVLTDTVGPSTDSVLVAGVSGGGDAVSPAWMSVFTFVWSSVTVAF